MKVPPHDLNYKKKPKKVDPTKKAKKESKRQTGKKHAPGYEGEGGIRSFILTEEEIAKTIEPPSKLGEKKKKQWVKEQTARVKQR